MLGSCDGWVWLELLERSAEGWVAGFVDALDELVACGLVSLDLDGRARMRGPIREFAHSLGPRSDLDRRLGQQAVGLAGRAAPRLFGADSGEALGELRHDEDTLVVALTRARKAGDAASAGALAIGLNRYWLLSGRLIEGRRWIQLAAALKGHGPGTSARLAVLSGTYAVCVPHSPWATIRNCRNALPPPRPVPVRPNASAWKEGLGHPALRRAPRCRRCLHRVVRLVRAAGLRREVHRRPDHLHGLGDPEPTGAMDWRNGSARSRPWRWSGAPTTSGAPVARGGRGPGWGSG